MTAVTSDYSDIQTQPELDQWATFLRLCSLENSRLSELRQTARHRLIESAQKFVLRLHGLSEDADLPDLKTAVLTGDPDRQPIVMTGHQPVVFHSGLTFKYEATQQFAVQENAIAVAVVIDTDQGDAGQFSYPAWETLPDSDGSKIADLTPSSADEESTPPLVESDSTSSNVVPVDADSPHPVSDSGPRRPVLAIETLAEPHRLYSHGRLKSVSDIKSIRQSIGRQLNVFGQTSAASEADTALGQIAQLAAARASMLEANTIMRWQRGIGDRMLELPLSAIAAFPECLMLTADVLKQPIRFASGYNAALHAYRDEHGIRNGANPFPDLKVGEQHCELPFWVVNHNRGTRHVLEVKLDGNVTHLLANGKTVDSFAGNITADSLEPMLLQNLQIIPRGALITGFLRLLFSDLFVHGTGGARYDRFTDEFIRSWWNAEPPPFTVATASRHLFQGARQEIQRLKQIEIDLRELQYNPQRFFGRRIFSPDLETRLIELIKEKQAAVDCMKSFHAEGQSAKEAGKAIQQLTNMIKRAVIDEFRPQLEQLNSVTAEQTDAINCRTYPWFFFAR